MEFSNDGNNITKYTVNMFYTSYLPSDVLNKLSIPYDEPSPIVPFYTGLFGKPDKYLLKSSFRGVGGPSGVKSITYEYSFDSEGRVKEIKTYIKEYARTEPAPNHGVMQLTKYEYIFD